MLARRMKWEATVRSKVIDQAKEGDGAPLKGMRLTGSAENAYAGLKYRLARERITCVPGRLLVPTYHALSRIGEAISLLTNRSTLQH